MTYHTYDPGDANTVADPCAELDGWDDVELRTAAEAVIANGPPYGERERTMLALAFGEELYAIGIAAAQVRTLIDEWHIDVKPVQEFKTGLAELRRENLAIVRARVTYQRALSRLKLTRERKAARSAVLDACVEAFHAGDVSSFDLYETIEAWLKLAPTASERAA